MLERTHGKKLLVAYGQRKQGTKIPTATTVKQQILPITRWAWKQVSPQRDSSDEAPGVADILTAALWETQQQGPR